MKKSQPKKSEPTSSARFAEGQKLGGSYVLKQRIESGDAEVWRAFDDVLGKEVALHFIPTKIAGDGEAMTALRQEVKRARQLIHPNILRVYDLVADVDWAAISMDAHDDESLASKISAAKDGALDAGILQAWLGQLFQTMDDAHKINVLHRDLSPQNLLLGKDGKLLVKNFGISRVLADATARISGKSDPGSAARSPQQLGGATATLGDDIHAIGAVLFEALAGHPPQSGKDISAQMQSARGKGAAPVPESWVKTIAACLAEAPEARPQKAGEIGARLGPVVAVENAPAAEPEKVAVVSAVAAASSSEIKSPSSSETSETSKKTEVPTMPVEQKSAPAASPTSTATKSRIPFVGLSLAAALAAFILVRDLSIRGGKATLHAEAEAVQAPVTQQPAEQELRPVSNTLIDPVPAPESAVEALVPIPPRETVQPASSTTPDEPVQLAALAAAPLAAVAAASLAPVAAAPVAAQTDEDKLVAEKAAAVETAKQAAQTAEKAHAEMAKKQQQVAAEVAAAEKALEQKTKTVGPVKKAAEEVLAQRKKLEDEQKAADLAAEQARQLAEEKARLAAVAQKAIGELAAKNKDKLSAQEKADAELQALQKALAEKQASGADVTKAAAGAEAARQQHLAAIKQSERDLEQARLAAAEARRLREEAEAERRKLAQELTEMQRMMEKKKAEIEDRLRKLEKADARPPVAAPVPEPVKPAEKPATPAPVVKPVVQATPPPATPAPVAALPLPVAPPAAATSLPATPPPAIAEAKPVSAPPPPVTPTQLALKTDPEKLPATLAPKPAAAPGSENTLGLKFVPVGDVEFCVWQTRVKDFEAFAKNAKVSGAWKSPGFKQGPDHPVVNVTWVEALAFCKWLTDQDHKDGTLAANQFYRLPTDVEWSKAVGLPEETGKTPEERDMGVPDVYPWGNQWPPPAKAGNYTGEETGSDVAIKGFDDGYPWTSPVGSFPPNKLGLYDMGGNVWQWCMDTKNSTSKAKVLRGASWYNGALKLSLLSSCRVSALPDSSTDNYGFRVVRAGPKK